jgi:hypothetical protein
MQWSRKRPTQPGFYWVRNFKLTQYSGDPVDKNLFDIEKWALFPTVIECKFDTIYSPGPRVFFTGDSHPYEITEGEFCGPLEAPK